MLEKQPLETRVNAELSTIGEPLDKTYRNFQRGLREKRGYPRTPTMNRTLTGMDDGP
jgi:hypothetical protein